MVIIAKKSGEEIRALKYSSYDFEVGDETSDFEIKILTNEWEEVPEDALVFIPDTEYGGIYRRTEIDTKQGYIAIGGMTWRGMLMQKIIEPLPGDDYAVDEGDINTIIGQRVEQAFGGLMVGMPPCGVSVSYRYNRYVTLYDGLKAMLKKAGYKLRIRYSEESKRVTVDAVPIVDYSSDIQFSSDFNTNYYINEDGTGVNHLICLGNGKLKNRIVVHLYVDASGNISQTPTFTGLDEVAAVYDYAGANEEQLIQSGTQQLQSMRPSNQFSISVDAYNLEIGDIVGGKDYIFGLTMKAPVTGKIYKSSGGIESTEYTISNNVEVE